MDKLMEGKVALVTGGSSGMGRAVAEAFAAEGAAVVIAARGEEKSRDVIAEIEASGGTARFYGPTDVTSREAIECCVEKTLNEFGRIDICAIFAGATFDHKGLSEDECYERTIAVNQTGAYHTAQAVLPHMEAQGSGNILICSSAGAFSPTGNAFVYHMTKGACETLTVNLAFAYAPKGIRVNCIKPGPIVTEFWDEVMPAGPERDAVLEGIGAKEIPLQRTGTPEDIVGPALFLASEMSQYITGLCLYAAGGMGYVFSQGQVFR